MRSRELQRQKRYDLAWCFLGIVIVQVGMVVCLERYWVAVRDPQYADVERILQERQAEARGRPLVVALGSSCTAFAFRAGRLNNPADETAPVVVNGALFGSGPIMQQVVLRRILRAGVRPNLLFVEAAPLFLSPLEDDVVEGKMINPVRLTAAELVRVCSCSENPNRFCRGWVRGRALPGECCQAEFRAALGIDLPASARSASTARDLHGWVAPPTTISPRERETNTRRMLEVYASTLTQPSLAPGPLRSLHDTLELCRRERIPAVLVAPPESQVLRSYCPAVEEAQVSVIRDLAREFGTSLVDARDWVDDDGFCDGHHTCGKGSDQYTDRFGREVLAPCLSSGKPGPAPAIVRTGR